MLRADSSTAHSSESPSSWHGLLVALIAACPAAPSPLAPWVWGAVVIVVVIVMAAQPVLTQRRAQSV